MNDKFELRDYLIYIIPGSIWSIIIYRVGVSNGLSSKTIEDIIRADNIMAGISLVVVFYLVGMIFSGMNYVTELILKCLNSSLPREKIDFDKCELLRKYKCFFEDPLVSKNKERQYSLIVKMLKELGDVNVSKRPRDLHLFSKSLFAPLSSWTVVFSCFDESIPILLFGTFCSIMMLYRAYSKDQEYEETLIYELNYIIESKSHPQISQ